MAEIATGSGLRIAYDVAGNGPPLLLIGGLSADRPFWGFARPRLNSFRTIAFDNRDVGESERATGPYTPAHMAQDALAVLDAAGIERAHVLGHSLGGVIAQELALMAPARVDRLVLACAYSRADLYVRELVVMLKRLRAELADPESYIAALATFTLGRAFLEANALSDIARATVGLGRLQEVAAFHRQADASLAADTLDRLGGIKAPTLVISTLDDRFFSDAFAQEMAAAIPGAVKRDMPGIGHCPMIEAPEAFTALIRDFLTA